MIVAEIIAGPLPLFEQERLSGLSGAELVFHGCVRAEEEGRGIVALGYEHYEGMAQQELTRLAQETVERFALNDLLCWHRVGDVPVGDTAVRVVVRAAHRGPALEGLSYFISELKQRVPIWKWAVLANGERMASERAAR